MRPSCWSPGSPYDAPRPCARGASLRLVPWSVVLFAVVLFVVVDLLVDEGSSVLRTLFGSGGSLAALGQLAGTSTLLANG